MIMMRSRRLFTVAVLLLVCLSRLSAHISASTVARDVSALTTLHQAWFSPLPDWIGNDPCGSQWQGVTCGGPSGDQVTKLALASSNLTGPISEAIGNLASLESLELSFNHNMGGSLPEELGQLTSLASLSIMSSGLTGSIPESLSNCVNLSFLALNQNFLDGEIPDVLGGLKQLAWFDVSENEIVGPLPVSSKSLNKIGLDNLTSAQHFHFNNNSIGGGIPPDIFNAPNLVHLLLDGNFLQGSLSLPDNAACAKTLQILRVDSNLLSNPLPEGLNQLTALEQLQLNNNQFSGSLPDLSQLTDLLLLDVSFNAFEAQEVPSWFYSLDKVLTLNANRASLNGSLDPSIFTLGSLQTVSLTDNALSGVVNFTGNSPSSLVLIDLENNDLTGLNGQPTVNGLSSAVQTRLAGNPFCDNPLQSGSGYCKSPVQTPPTWTNSSGTSCKQTCVDRKTLNPNICSCSFPLVCYMQFVSPAFSSVDDSMVQSISNELATGFSLDPSQVYIGYANFTTDKKLLFDVFFFPRSGDVAFDTNEATNITATLSKNQLALKEGPALLNSYIAPPTTMTKAKSSMSIGLIVGIVAGVLLIAGILGCIVLYAVRQKRRADKAEVSQPFASWGTQKGDAGAGAAPQLKGARWLSLLEIKRATNNFHEDNQIGSGGYGKVYKAKLSSGEVVAVKRAEAGSLQGKTEFKNEIETLSRVHHRNLVGLVGFCYEHGEQMLVYEYMPNGTLRDHLLGPFDVPLNWASRVNIALGSAKGLAYLHEHANPRIIHRDIKSNNILLDDGMVAKVADFGLSKLAPDGRVKNHVSTQVKGTLGYLDPEYYMTNQLSEKSDVYSFGVVLLEILSARQPIEQGRYIVREVRTALDRGGMKALKPILDPYLGDYPEKEMEAVLDLALRCVEEMASNRPKMNEVVQHLELIAGRSQTNSGTHITIEPQKRGDPYEDENGGNFKRKNDPSFEYSGGFVLPTAVHPK